MSPLRMTARPIVYSFRRCPYAMRARMALLASGTSCEIREVRLAAKPDELIAASSKGTVPVLVLPAGQVIDQSLDIMRWALARHDPDGWLVQDDAELIAANDGPFKQHLDRYKYPDRYGSDPVMHRASALEFLDRLETRLSVRPCLCGAAPGIADAAIFPFVRQFAAIDRAWFDALPLTALKVWLRHMLASAVFAAAMIRLPPWQPGNAPVVFAADRSLD